MIKDVLQHVFREVKREEANKTTLKQIFDNGNDGGLFFEPNLFGKLLQCYFEFQFYLCYLARNLGEKIIHSCEPFVLIPIMRFLEEYFYSQLLIKLSLNTYLPPIESSCGWAPAVFLCERRSDPPGLLLGRLDIGTSLLKGHTLSRHYHSLKGKKK